MKTTMPLIFGQHDAATITQLNTCVEAEEGALGVLCADGHLGYSMPIGGVVGYRNFISPSGVGYDIACGNMAVRTEIKFDTIPLIGRERIADEMFKRISFGMGRKNDEPVENAPIFEDIANSPVKEQRALLSLARSQAGTVGSGNHYVDLLEDADGYLWIACHFGSRGFGHKTATMFMNIAQGLDPLARTHDGEMMSPPLLLDVRQPSGQDYIEAMKLAGEYAYAGRRYVIAKVLDILGQPAVLDIIHNHHNFAWREGHFDENFWVVRKGATPAFPGQRGFVGGSMADISVVVSGKESTMSRMALYSTVHGAGRVMSRNQAIKGKHAWFCAYNECDVRFIPPQQKPPKDMKCPEHRVALVKESVTPAINFRDVQDKLKTAGIILRGAGADEAPQCYRPLGDVLMSHHETIGVETVLTPRIVCMAGKDIRDDYKD